MPFRSPRKGKKAPIAEAIKSITADTGTGFFQRDEAFRPASIRDYFDWYDTEGTVRSAINALSEAATGRGYETIPETDEGETPLEGWKEAKRLVDEFGEALNLDSLLPNICRCMLIAGFCFVETQIKKYPSKCTLKIIHPKTVKEIVPDRYGNVEKIVQVVDNKDVTIDGKNLTLFVHNQIANNLKGTSLIKSVETLLSIKRTAVDTIGKIIERRLAPKIVWKSTRDLGGIKEAVEGCEANEDIFAGNLTLDEMKDLFEIVEIGGDTKYWEFVEYIDKLVYVGLYAPDLYYWRNATEASARVLSEMVDRNVAAIQRNMKRGIEAGFFARLMKANGLDLVPRLEWSVKKIGFEDLDFQLILLELFRLGIAGAENAQILFDQGGLEIGKLRSFMLPEEPEMEEPEEGEENGEDETDVE